MPEPTPTEMQPTRFALVEGASPVPGYVLIKRLGRGGFGEVWLASSPGDYRVALKFLQLDHRAGQVEIKHLQHLKEIRHANLLSVFGAWEVDGFLVLAMELAHGTLADELRTSIEQRNSGIPAAQLFEHLRDAARGIDYLNEKGIIHRDIKPANLLVVGDSVKVGDFGLAKLMDQTLAANSSGYTIHYAAPELFRSQVSRSVDQYALAVTYCELRGSRLPFIGNQYEVMAKHATETPDLSMLPASERAAVLRALAKKPEERWTSCREFVSAVSGQKTPVEIASAPGPIAPRMQGFVSTVAPGIVDSATPVVEPSWKPVSKVLPKSRKKWYIGIAAAAFASLIGLGLWGMLSSGSSKYPEPPPSSGTMATGGDKPKEQPLAILDAPKPEPPIVEAKPAIVRFKPISPVSVYPGESADLKIAIERENMPGELELWAVGAPSGVTIAPLRLAAGETQLSARLTASRVTNSGSSTITVSTVGFEQKAETQFALTVRPAPYLHLRTPDPVTVTAGQSVHIALVVNRENLTEEVTLSVADAPAGITIAPLRLASGETKLMARLTAAASAPAGTVLLTIKASAGHGHAETVLKLTVRPAEPPRLDSTKGAVDADTVKKIQQQWADKLGIKAVEEFDLSNGVKLEMVLVPPGEYLMGSPKSEQDEVKKQYKDAAVDDEKQKRITIHEPFYLAKTELTQQQHAALTGNSPSHFSASGDGKEKVKGLDTSKFPVERVSWDEATHFCKQLEAKTGKRFKLPKEQEWEYACRAGTTTTFHFGAELNGEQANCDGNFPFGTESKGPYLERTCKVGSYQPNALGLCDMHGNVWEWCEDDYEGSRRVLRGGACHSYAWGCRTAIRDWFSPVARSHDLGFRPALVPWGK